MDTSENEEGLGRVEVDTADGAIVLVEAVYDGAHAVIPELDHPAVEAGQDTWPSPVEAQTLLPVALRFEFGQHLARPRPSKLQLHSSIEGKKSCRDGGGVGRRLVGEDGGGGDRRRGIWLTSF